MNPTPTVLFTGFLGAGKTTFLRDLLPLLIQRSLDPYVIINDCQNARVDAELLRETACEVTTISGNCICCDSIHQLVDALLAIPERVNRVVLIEANGTSDPFPLIEHLVALPALRGRFSPLLQLGMVDAARWQRRAWHNELERMQVQTASHHVFTRLQTESSERVSRVHSDVECLNPRTRESSPDRLADELAALVAEGIQHESLDFSTGHERGDHALAHSFVAMQIDLPTQVNGGALLYWLKNLRIDVLRVKGVAELTELPGIYFSFQRTDENSGRPTVFPLHMPPVVPPCAVLIGVRLNEEELTREALALFSAPHIAAA